MKNSKKRSQNRPGVVFVVAMIFVALLTSISVSMVAMTSANAQMANNHKRGNRGLANSQSGMEIVRHLLEGMPVSGSLDARVQSQLASKGLTGITAICTVDTITLSSVALDSGTESFSAFITLLEDRWQVDVTGVSGNLSRTVRVNFNLIEQGNSVFDFGVATKGPLDMSGQAELTGFNLAVESDVFIDYYSIDDPSFVIGNQALVEGTVHIVDPDATYDIGVKSEVGGEIGVSAEDNIVLGVDPVEFPTPDPEYFRTFATGDVIDSSTVLSNYSELNNVIIAANTNPTFASNMTVNGILFVEQPNNVTFAGKVNVTGIIVSNSEIGSPDGGSFDFSGQVTCGDTSTLVGDEFADIKEETGTFLIAPGSVVDFTGQSNVINGVIACSGARFTGLAGGVINGSIINYSSEPMVMQGQGSLSFNRSGTSSSPAGFEPVEVLDYDPDSYQEIR